MTAPQDIRAEILLQLYSARHIGLSTSLMGRQARKAGLPYTNPMFDAEAAFLLDQQLVANEMDPTTGVIRYRITANGILHHENNR